MKKLLMLSGLPGCGKTTLANELVKNEGYKRVNKDDLRAMIDSSKWSKENEKQIIEARDLLVISYLDAGYNVVVDDTNLHPSHRESLAEIADNCDAEFEEKFIDVPVMTCIERDAKRGEKSVGAKVIMGMWTQYLRPSPPEWSEDKQNVYIFDVDNTLAHITNRSPYDFTKVGDDDCDQHVGNILRMIKASGLPVIILSGREDSCRKETEQWLQNNSLPYDYIFMRQTGDNRKDSIIKKEIYEKYIEPYFNVLGVFDDRLQVCCMWAELGLTLFKVGHPYDGFF